MLRAAAVAVTIFAVWAGSARGQTTPQVRLAAAADCARNVNCIPGFRRVYHMDPSSEFVTLKVADAGIQALDDGAAEVAVAFSSNPQLSRPDVLVLADDRHMITQDHIVPIVRRAVLRRYGRPLRRRLNLASRLLSTLELRGLNQQVLDGRLPEAVGGQFADANGLGGPSRRRAGPVIRIGYQTFDENHTLAEMYAEALRGAGFRVRVRAIGLRPAMVRAMRHRRVDMWAGYSGSLLGYLGGRSLKRSVARIGAAPLALSPAQDRDGFAMKRDVADSLGVHKLSDLARYWPAAAAGAAVTARAADALQGEQWAVAKGSLLDLPGAWRLAQGQGVTVAIVDTGARIEHPDLAPNIWTNFGEVPGNGVDDDHNGYVDDVHGVDLTSDKPGQDLTDGNGHGTHVSGIVAAAQNGRGVVGVAPRAHLMIVKACNALGACTTGALAEGIRYAAANGARIINVSAGATAADPRLVDAVQAAGAANALVVAAAGNAGQDIDRTPLYPAAIAAPNLIAVASTDPQDGRGISQFSNYGRLAVQVAAPGAFILSTANDGSYATMSGTSMAAPMVSGVAALAASVNPGLSAVDLRSVILENATRSSLPVSSGYVDALHAVLAASPAAASGTGDPPSIRVLSATRKAGRIKARAAVTGSTVGIGSYRVRIDRRTVAQLRPGPSPLSITLRRRRGRRIEVQALAAGGKVVASGARRITVLRAGKREAGTGSGARI